MEKVAQVSEVRHFYSPIVLRRSISFRPGKCVHCYAFGALWSTTILVTIRIESQVQLTTIAEVIVLAYFTCRQCWIRFNEETAALRAEAEETTSGAEFGCCTSFGKFRVDYSDVYVVVYDFHSIVLGISQGGSLEMYILDISLA